MKVILKRDAFIDDVLYRVANNPVEVPETSKAKLPKSATVLEGPTPEKPKPVVQTTLRDYDEVRHNSDAEQSIRNKDAETKKK